MIRDRPIPADGNCPEKNINRKKMRTDQGYFLYIENTGKVLTR
jgi:hypothetical protein